MKKEEEHHTLYTYSYWEIFWKNFLVGFARGLGGMVTYLVMLVIVYYAFLMYVMPKITPFLTTFQRAQDNLERIQNPGSMFDSMFQGESNSTELDTPRNTR